MGEEEHTCCCCFGLRTGVWLIGLLHIASFVANLITAFRTGGWFELSIQLIIQLVFTSIFVLHMTSESRQHHPWRNALFWVYFIFITILSAAIGYLAVFGYWGNPVNDVCNDPNILEQLTMSECKNFVFISLGMFITLNLVMNMYLSFKLLQWAKVKKEEEGMAAYGALPGSR